MTDPFRGVTPPVTAASRAGAAGNGHEAPSNEVPSPKAPSALNAIARFRVSSRLFIGLLFLGCVIGVAACGLNRPVTLQMAAKLADRRQRANAPLVPDRDPVAIFCAQNPPLTPPSTGSVTPVTNLAAGEAR